MNTSLVPRAIARCTRRHGPSDVARLHAAGVLALRRAETAFRPEIGPLRPYARRAVRRAVAREHDATAAATPCPCCRDVGVAPTGPETWGPCTCEAAIIRSEFLASSGEDEAVTEDEQTAWHEAGRA